MTFKVASTTSSISPIPTSIVTYSNSSSLTNAASFTNTTVSTNTNTKTPDQDSHIKPDKNGFIYSNNVAVVFHDSQIIGSAQIGNATNQTCSDYASSVQAPYFSLTASNECRALSGFVTTFEDVKGYTYGQYQSSKSVLPSTSPSTSPTSGSNTTTTNSNSSDPALPTCEGYFLVSNSQNLWCMQSNFDFSGENGILSSYPIYDLSFCRDICDVGYAGSCLAVDYYDTGECYWLAGTASGGASANGVTAGFKSPSGSWANHPPACNSTSYVSTGGASWTSQCDFSFNGTGTNVLDVKDSVASLYSCTEYCDLAYPGISVAVDFYRIASDVGPAGRCICLDDISTLGGGPYLGIDAAMTRTHSNTASCLSSPGYLDAQENYWTLQCNFAFRESDASLLETRNNLQTIQSCVDYCDLIHGQEVGAVNFARNGTCDCFANTSNSASPADGIDTAILASIPGRTRNQDGCGERDSNDYFRFCNLLPVFGDSDLVGIRKSSTYSNQACSDYAKSLNATYFGLGPDYVCSAFSSYNQLGLTPCFRLHIRSRLLEVLRRT